LFRCFRHPAPFSRRRVQIFEDKSARRGGGDVHRPRLTYRKRGSGGHVSRRALARLPSSQERRARRGGAAYVRIDGTDNDRQKGAWVAEGPGWVVQRPGSGGRTNGLHSPRAASPPPIKNENALLFLRAHTTRSGARAPPFCAAVNMRRSTLGPLAPADLNSSSLLDSSAISIGDGRKSLSTSGIGKMLAGAKPAPGTGKKAVGSRPSMAATGAGGDR
jgi:hypothetical protein